MREYLRRINLPYQDTRHCSNILHITGTKGKGSTAALSDNYLREKFPCLNVGLFTSPHLADIRERIRINGKPVSKEMFGISYWEVRQRLEKWNKNNLELNKGEEEEKNDFIPVLPGYFRMLCLIAFYCFAHARVPTEDSLDSEQTFKPIDVMILEVGMGGRFDATNIFDHNITNTICAITLIDLDHTRVLGNTLEKIAWEKGGIFLCDKNDTVSYKHSEGNSISSQRTACITPTPKNMYFTIETNTESVTDVLRSCLQTQHIFETDDRPNLYVVKMGEKIPEHCNITLAGDHQRLNAELAVSICDALIKRMKENGSLKNKNQNENAIKNAMNSISWPGRCQTLPLNLPSIPCRPNVILRCDGAHTTKSIVSCMEWFRHISGYDKQERTKKRILIFNCNHERNPVPLLNAIISDNTATSDGITITLFDSVYFCTSDTSRPSMVKQATSVELFEEAGLGFASSPENDRNVAPTWQETLGFIWRDLERIHYTKNSSFPIAEMYLNMKVREAIQHITTNHHTINSKNELCEIEVCVTGSLYLIGSILTAVDWKEESSSATFLQ